MVSAVPPGRPIRPYPFYIHLTVLFSLLILLMGGFIAWLGYTQGRDITLAATEDMFAHVGRETRSDLREAFQPVTRFADMLALQPIVETRNLEERLRTLPLLRQAFADDAPVAAVYVGYADGSFFLLRPLAEEAERRIFNPPAEARYLVQSIERGASTTPRSFYLFFDGQLREIERRRMPQYLYDPRTRPWYQLAGVPGQRVFTEPYAFYSTGAPGVTVAKRANAHSVVGIDITLAHLSGKLTEMSSLPGMRIALFDEQRRLLARSDPERSLVRREDNRVLLYTLDDSGDALLGALRMDAQGESQTLNIDGRQWKSVVLPLNTVRGSLYLAIAVPLDELLKDLRAMHARNALISLLVLLCAIPLTALAAHSIARALRRITAQAKDIRAFKFDGPTAGRSIVLEVDELSQAMTMMRDTVRNFLDTTTSLAAETNFDRLLERVVWENCEAMHATGGLIYLPDAEQARLRPAALMDQGGAHLEILLPSLAADGDSPIATAFRDGATLSLELPARREFAPLHNAWRGEKLGLIAIPLRERNGERVGVLALIMPNIDTPSRSRLAFAEALSGTAAVAIETQKLLESRKELLEAFIQLVAGAIDAKSPYTGGHCQRVPELTFMLAQAACDAKEGPYKDFCLDEQQWEALHIAGWLHDCGKVTTPEYVVDKATKLETIYDRLHEIRMRFEVLKRDAEIDYLKQVAAGGDAVVLAARRDALLAELDGEFAFIATCNEGGEFMAPESIERLEKIGRRTWTRTLDNSIGLGHEERKRRGTIMPPPVTETLLADKPEHLLERPPTDEIKTDHNLGFNMRAPQYKYNRGELHNLRVARGTLSDEERYIINHHIVQTIIMLSQLPWPRHLRDVPDIAGGHHERMDGKGYPRGLRREQMSDTARMMAIADIFEALTACDRPYKKAKTVSESLKILQKMKQDQHVDPELYELFIDAGVWRIYAERFLQPEQIDVKDASAYR